MDQIWPVASTLARDGLTCVFAPAFPIWLLLAHNPLLLDCTVYWAGRFVLRVQWAAQWVRWASSAIEASLHGLPLPPPPPPWSSGVPRGRRLCSNGDHSNFEETRIVVGEHFQRILGTILMAAVLAATLSWILPPVPRLALSSSPSSSSDLPRLTNPPVQSNLLPDPWASADFIHSGAVVEQNSNDIAVVTDTDAYTDAYATINTNTALLPRRHYHRPPSQFAHGADPRVRIRRDVPGGADVRDVVVRGASPASSQMNKHLPPLGASGFAAARKAARQAQEAAADQWVLALRQRLMDENREAKGLSVGTLHGDDDGSELALARSAFGLGCTACGDGSAVFVDVDALFDDVVRRHEREGRQRPDDRFDYENPHDRDGDASW
ncbi:uncharacterized protein SPSK_09450 [Sporothrix schenckii 1099-18]|uniref:Uncharacterized protein n=1 Tax=Sporothrix schenckii 1099-18 TaxID=1397361 RepID=A0A0F2M3M8_SPOSC|nr:uncharacterized protein SPSK_09450 [Sporothrix schenckii 1099-18]KJR84303.1 hypothetical protein SPSK_09450 [Sporothrix schenckii 1099-18]